MSSVTSSASTTKIRSLSSTKTNSATSATKPSAALALAAKASPKKPKKPHPNPPQKPTVVLLTMKNSTAKASKTNTATGPKTTTTTTVDNSSKLLLPTSKAAVMTKKLKFSEITTRETKPSLYPNSSTSSPKSSTTPLTSNARHFTPYMLIYIIYGTI